VFCCWNGIIELNKNLVFSRKKMKMAYFYVAVLDRLLLISLIENDVEIVIEKSQLLPRRKNH